MPVYTIKWEKNKIKKITFTGKVSSQTPDSNHLEKEYLEDLYIIFPSVVRVY